MKKDLAEGVVMNCVTRIRKAIALTSISTSRGISISCRFCRSGSVLRFVLRLVDTMVDWRDVERRMKREGVAIGF